MIYLPEREFSIEKFLDDIRLAQQKYKAVVVAVSEGIDCSGGKTGVVDAFGHSYLSGVGKYLENITRERIGCKVRSIELNVMQRCGSHIASLTDLEEAEKIGAEAVKTAIEYNNSGVMMTFKRISNNPYRVDIVPCDVRDCANKAKYFPVEWINDEGNNVTIDALNYFLPLIKGEPVIEYKNGIPVHFRLNQ
jgi:6-phosphofructokinase 1